MKTTCLVLVLASILALASGVSAQSISGQNPIIHEPNIPLSRRRLGLSESC
jgi:hypothetical protein